MKLPTGQLLSEELADSKLMLADLIACIRRIQTGIVFQSVGGAVGLVAMYR